jgi:putative membrane protein
MRRSPRTVPLLCLAVFTVQWAALAIAPRYRADWLLENLLTFVAVPAAVLTYLRRPLSTAAYVQITAFLTLHTIGSHYTYSEVPAGDWLRDALGLTRNHYDRVVHFAFGLLMLRPLRELTLSRSRIMSRPLTVWLSVAQVLACSVLYELIEWGTAAVVDPAAGTAFLGTQGDPWDAQKDMACASAGALLAALPESRRLRHAVPGVRNEPGRVVADLAPEYRRRAARRSPADWPAIR